MERSKNTGPLQTIGGVRRLGLKALHAYCERPGGCGHEGRVLHDALRLPDATVWIAIPSKVRLICSVCGRRSKSIFPDWTDHQARGNGRRPLID